MQYTKILSEEHHSDAALGSRTGTHLVIQHCQKRSVVSVFNFGKLGLSQISIKQVLVNSKAPMKSVARKILKITK